MDETNLAVIEASNQVFLVATPEIGSVRDLSRHVDVLSQNEQNVDKVKVVVNRNGSDDCDIRAKGLHDGT